MQGWHYGVVPALHSVLFNYTSSDVWLQHLYTRDPAKPNQCGLITRRVDLCIQRLYKFTIPPKLVYDIVN